MSDAAPWHASDAVDQRVEALLQQLSQEEKVDLVSGTIVLEGQQADRVASQPYRIPAFSIADGTAGVRVTNPASATTVTALPAAIALAATWNEEMARQHGDVLGAEAAATGHNILLGPAVDIARVPYGGRTFESFGEDPLLQARMAVPIIQAIQAHGVQACVKHYIVNNQEHQRNSIDVRVNERALREIYLPPFAAAVRAGVASVMGSYNQINGTWACEHPHVLTAVLRDEWGFRGYVMSDFLANHSTAESANAGLDWELSSHKLWGAHLLHALRREQVSVATLDEMVRRILRPTVGLGLLDQPLHVEPPPFEQHGAVARTISEQSMVLLENKGELLPFGDDIRSVAVIGPDADSVAAAGGGSAGVVPPYGISVLEGIRRRVGAAVRVEYVCGVDPVGPGVLLDGPDAVPASALLPPGSAPESHGLRAEYWSNPHFAGDPTLVRVDPQVQINRGFFDLPNFSAASPDVAPLPPSLSPQFSARWSGSLVAPASGTYTFALTALGSARLVFDEQQLIEVAATPEHTHGTIEQLWTGGGAQVVTATMELVAGERYRVQIEYVARPDMFFLYGGQIRFGWVPPAEAVLPTVAEAAALAAHCDAAVVVVRTYETEAQDRPSLQLPNNQEQLIRAVARANPRTVVMLMSGAAVEMPWVDAAPAVLQAWYGGQEQGNAVARVLWGDVNPSGKLPLSIPYSAEHTPLRVPEHYPGVDGVVQYSEGVCVGYRGYDQLGIAPRYPFGYGLSYTTFVYEQLVVTPGATNGEHAIQVRFRITNTGTVAGTEIAQVYLGLPASANDAPKRLAGWARVALEAGQTEQVTVVVDPRLYERPLSWWDAERGWQIARGEYQVYVGASSRDTRLSSTFSVQ